MAAEIENFLRFSNVEHDDAVISGVVYRKQNGLCNEKQCIIKAQSVSSTAAPYIREPPNELLHSSGAPPTKTRFEGNEDEDHNEDKRPRTSTQTIGFEENEGRSQGKSRCFESIVSTVLRPRCGSEEDERLRKSEPSGIFLWSVMSARFFNLFMPTSQSFGQIIEESTTVSRNVSSIFEIVKMVVGSYEVLLERVGSHNKHLLDFWDELSEHEKDSLARQIESIDFQSLHDIYEDSARVYSATSDNLTPIPDDHHIVFKNLTEKEKQRYWIAGLEAISKGELAVIVLAGGQSSRLGSSAPKGTIPLGLNVAPCDSLLGIQASKISLLQKLAAKEFPEAGTKAKIQWLVMTSKSTEENTRNHLKEVVPATGLTFEQITIFSQAEIPAFDNEGNLLLSDKHTIVTAPNGNGGLYSALSAHLPEMKSRGVKYFHVYCVDNILCKVADPHLLGFFIEKQADVATKTILKKPGELVGSVCLDNGCPRVVEYSELGAELAERKTDDGRLLFCAGSIANHFFSLEFLESFCADNFHLPYHRALKKIAHLSSDGKIVKPD
ncbi:hypothetical protein KIN20_026631 [Parelaphostrongylus tenuis]|uniref:UDP-N-acetylglucosamine diphosphorylase n=1 Tax=Parelaphostrongylus tenuis TaxID=148309 RepID=A0AAD5WD02_PARTN|nr:hypothetical protein KIN20_026631 [Parelaphostrongylus tenuis]